MADPQQSAPIDYDAVAKQYGAIASTPIDYSAVAKQYGAVSSSPVDYNASAKKYGAISSTPAPAPAAPPAQPAPDPLQGTISAAPDPTVWQRIKQAVTAGIPRYSSRTVYNPKYGQMQLVSPEEAMTPAEQERHPFLTGGGELAGGLTSPGSVALIAGTAGLGELPGAAAMLPRLMSAGFGAQAIYSAAKTYPEIRAAIERGDVPEVERLLTHAVGNLAMAALATQHAATGEPAVSGKTKAAVPVEPRATVQDVPVSPTSPVGELLHDPSQAPHVRVVDSSAVARDLLEKDTVLRPVVAVPSQIADPALAAVEAQSRGRAAEMAKKYSITPVQPDARTTGPADIAAFRLPAARVVNDSYVPVVATDEILADGVQKLIDNSAALRAAGVDPAQIKTHEDIDAALLRASDYMKSHLDPRASAIITLEGQRQLASDSGMGVEDLILKRNGQAFNAEQLVASRAILKASGDRVLGTAKAAAANPSDPDLLRDFSNAGSVHKRIQEQIASVRAESGRALGSFRIQQADLPQTKIADIIGEMPEKNQAAAADLVSRLDPTDPQSVRMMNQMLAEVTPSTTLDKLHEYYRNALLSSPHTLIVKTASEAAMAAMEATKKLVAAGISKVPGAAAKFKDAPDRFASEAWWYARGMMQALSEHAKPILTGEFQLEGSPGFERSGTKAIKGVTGSIIRTPTEAMSRMTNLLYAGNYYGEINALAARQASVEGLNGEAWHARQEWLSHTPTKEMRESAHKLATTNTFQGQLGSVAGGLEKVISTKPTDVAWLPDALKSVAPGRWLLPFFRTPVNLFKATLSHATPYELLNGIAKGDTDAMARGLVGSSIAVTLGMLALSGHLTGGGPVDYRKAETLRATGWEPYSFKIGNSYVSYRRFEPVGLAASLVADTIHSAMTGDSEVVTQSKADTAIHHILRSVDDFPMLGTVGNLLQSIHDPTSGVARSFVNREAGSLIPSALANIAETGDPTVRRPATATQAIQSRVPGMTQAAPAIVDVSGRTVQRPINNLGGANPFPLTTARHDPIVDELSRLGVSTPQAPKQIGKVALTDTEKQKLMQQEGRELYQTLAESINNGSWQQRTDDQKRRAITEFHRQQDRQRAGRLNAMRRQTQDDLARSSL
jgi:hypothetical protein